MTSPPRKFLGISVRTPAFALTLVCALGILAIQPAQAQILRVIHTFTGGGDGSYPKAGLTVDAAGNFYGTAFGGGIVSGGCAFYGCGTVFKLKHRGSGWILTPLYSFTGGNDGANPYGRVAIAQDGTLYGTTYSGGGSGCMGYGCGTVFRLTPSQSAPKSALV